MLRAQIIISAAALFATIPATASAQEVAGGPNGAMFLKPFPDQLTCVANAANAVAHEGESCSYVCFGPGKDRVLVTNHNGHIEVVKIGEGKAIPKTTGCHLAR
jgi:hypothetical protein